MPAPTPDPVNTFQDNWVFCVKCLCLFWNGRSDNGHCPKGGAHQANSWDFFLPANSDNRIVQEDNLPVGP